MSNAANRVDPARTGRMDRHRTFVAFAVGVAAAAPFIVMIDTWVIAVLVGAGLVVASFAPRRREGLGGLLAGVALTLIGWGAIEVVDKVRSCAVDGCSGMSAPSFTAWIVVAVTLAAMIAASVGYLAGRAAVDVLDRVRGSRS